MSCRNVMGELARSSIQIMLEKSGAIFACCDEGSPFFFPPAHILTHFLVAKHVTYPKEESVLVFGDEERRKEGEDCLKVG